MDPYREDIRRRIKDQAEQEKVFNALDAYARINSQNERSIENLNLLLEGISCRHRVGWEGVATLCANLFGKCPELRDFFMQALKSAPVSVRYILLCYLPLESDETLLMQGLRDALKDKSFKIRLTAAQQAAMKKNNCFSS